MQNIIVTTSDELRRLIGEAVRLALAEALPHQPDQDEKLLNEHELRAMLGLSHSTVIRLRKQGLLPYLRLGKRIMYNRAEVRLTMETQAFRGGRR